MKNSNVPEPPPSLELNALAGGDLLRSTDSAPVDIAPATAGLVSVSRPMTDEDRAALEEVYRERGCGVECDC